MSPHRSEYQARLLPQTAVYWGSPTPTGEGGYTFADPIEIDCRWEEKWELIRVENDRDLRAMGPIFVDRVLDMNGYMYKGTLNDLGSAEEADPQTVENAWQIKMRGETPNTRGINPTRRVWLG